MRAAIFIDGGYFFKQIQGNKLEENYQHLADFLLQPLRSKSAIDLMRCYFYYCAPYMSQTPTEDENRRMTNHLAFVEKLEAIPRWQFRSGKLEKRRDGDRDVFAQKRVDVKLSVDLVRHAAAGHIQHAIIVAGDSDFIPAVMAAKEEGVTVTLCVHNDKSAHRDLLKLVDEVRWIDWNQGDQSRKNRPDVSKKPRQPRTDKPSSVSQQDKAVSPEAHVKDQKIETPTSEPHSQSKKRPVKRTTKKVASKAPTRETSAVSDPSKKTTDPRKSPRTTKKVSSKS